jgi:Zn-dependent peptidase ImmA (M78 family)
MGVLANNLLDEYVAQGNSANPPFDVEKLAKIRRVLEISRTNSESSGRLVPTEGGFCIFIGGSESDTSSFSPREVFTCAHEIGHTYFYEVEASKPILLTKKIYLPKAQIEHLCDSFAAQLLLPDRHLRKSPLATQFTHKSVQETLRIFNVSLETLLIRCREIDLRIPTRHIIILFKRSDDRENGLEASTSLINAPVPIRVPRGSKPHQLGFRYVAGRGKPLEQMEEVKFASRYPPQRRVGFTCYV